MGLLEKGKTSTQTINFVGLHVFFGGVKKQQNVLLLSKRMQGFKDQNGFEWPQVETYTKVSLFLNLIECYPPGN